MPGLDRIEQPLSDGTIALRHCTADDIPALVANLNDPEIARWTRVPHPYTREHAEAYMAAMEDRRRTGQELALVTTSATDGTLLGTHNLRVTSWEHRRGELGATVFPHARGRQVSVRAGHLLARHAFDTLGLARVEILAAVDNPAVQLATERAGFIREGVLRSYVQHDGERADLVMWSVLPGEV